MMFRSRLFPRSLPCPVGRFRPDLEVLEERTVPALLTAPTPFAAGTNPVAAVVADFNKDGIPDVAIADGTGNSITVLLGNGTGFQTPGLVTPLGSSPLKLAVGDLNNDGLPDLVVITGTNSVGALIGKGNGHFNAIQTSPVPGLLATQQVVIGDFNNDGNADVVATNGSLLTVGQGSGTGTFSFPFGISNVFGTITGLVAADFNKDGNLDLVAVSSGAGAGNGVYLFYGDGKGGLAAGTLPATSSLNATGVALGNFDGDSYPDFVVSFSNSTPQIFKNNGSTFTQDTTSLAALPSGTAVATGDSNQDGFSDVFLINSSTNQLFVAASNGTGGFQLDPDNAYTTGSSPVALATADENADGAPDVVVAESGSNNLDLYYCRLKTKTTVTSSNPSTVYGQPVTFTATVSVDLFGSFANGVGLDDPTAPAGQKSTVTFFDNGVAIGTAPVTIVGLQGQAQLTVPSLGVNPLLVGNHSITAKFTPGAIAKFFFKPSTSAAIGESVAPANTATIFSVPGPVSAVYGQVLTVSATAAAQAPGAGIPTGTMTFFDNGTFLGTVGLDATGAASIQVSASLVGPQVLQAVYNGDANFAPSGAASGSLTLNVSKAATTTTLLSLLNPSALGQVVTLQIAVAAVSPGSGTPTGTVSITDNGSPLASNVPLVNGVALFQTAGLTAGTHNLVATYSGDGNFNSSAANAVQTVTGSPPPPVTHPRYLVTGAGAGAAPQVNVYDATTGLLVNSFLGLPGNFTGGVRVAVGDVNNDGTPDIIVGAGPGAAPQITVYDGVTFQAILSFYSLPQSFTGGVFVAAGDVNHDGYADVIVSADKGGGPQVTVNSGKDGALLSSFYATVPSFTGGIRVASGDVNGDGFADVIAAAGPGGGPQVTIFDGKTLSVLTAFYAVTPSFTGGLFVASGDVNGDGKADIITGADAGGGPQVNVFNGPTQAMLASFYALPASFTGGVRVGTSLPLGATHANIVAAAGPTGSPQVSIFDGLTLKLLNSFYAYPQAFTGGVYLG